MYQQTSGQRRAVAKRVARAAIQFTLRDMAIVDESRVRVRSSTGRGEHTVTVVWNRRRTQLCDATCTCMDFTENARLQAMCRGEYLPIAVGSDGPFLMCKHIAAAAKALLRRRFRTPEVLEPGLSGRASITRSVGTTSGYRSICARTSG